MAKVHGKGRYGGGKKKQAERKGERGMRERQRMEGGEKREKKERKTEGGRRKERGMREGQRMEEERNERQEDGRR